MSDISERYAALVADFAARLDGTTGDAWSAQSPCADWTARDVVAHVVGIQRGAAAAVTGQPPAGDLGPDEDASAAFKEVTATVIAGLEDPEIAARVVPGPFGAMPFEQMVGRIIATDMLVHTWDLARATGQDERLNPAVVSGAFSGLKPLDAIIRQPGLFGPAVEAPEGADEQTQFLCFLGRHV